MPTRTRTERGERKLHHGKDRDFLVDITWGTSTYDSDTSVRAATSIRRAIDEAVAAFFEGPIKSLRVPHRAYAEVTIHARSLPRAKSARKGHQ